MFNNYIQPAKSKTRLMYVIVQCVPILIMLKASISNCLIVPMKMNNNDPLKCLLKQLTAYLRDSLSRQGQHQMAQSTKLILSERHNQMFMCSEPDIFE